MNTIYKSHIPSDFPESSRVWIYQSSREFSPDEILQIEELLVSFRNTWHSHGEKVRDFAQLLFGRFIVLMADETLTQVGGCSTDFSIKYIKNLGKDFNTEFFDRSQLAFIVKERIQIISLDDVNTAIEEEYINGDTFYFNNTILTKKELLHKWIIPVKESWLASRITSFSKI
ncbi:MAG: hypothetical protein JSS98_02230 [Bacteroidetes bacterium]|nr:hypothetical protein [Bacteroidota bacterium]